MFKLSLIKREGLAQHYTLGFYLQQWEIDVMIWWKEKFVSLHKKLHLFVSILLCEVCVTLVSKQTAYAMVIDERLKYMKQFNKFEMTMTIFSNTSKHLSMCTKTYIKRIIEACLLMRRYWRMHANFKSKPLATMLQGEW